LQRPSSWGLESPSPWIASEPCDNLAVVVDSQSLRCQENVKIAQLCVAAM
jgi:hypothetical protein